VEVMVEVASEVASGSKSGSSRVSVSPDWFYPLTTMGESAIVSSKED
jgi:hypothetical protein